MTTANRTIEDKAADTSRAFAILRDEITPAPIRELVNKMTSVPLNEDTDVAAYASLVQASITLARLVAGNDRTALLASAMLAQSGVTRPIIDTSED